MAVIFAIFIYRYNSIPPKGISNQSFGVIYAGTELDSEMLVDGNPILVYASTIEHVAEVLGETPHYFEIHAGTWLTPDTMWVVVPVIGTMLVKNMDKDEYVELKSKNNSSFLIIPPSTCSVYSDTHVNAIKLSVA